MRVGMGARMSRRGGGAAAWTPASLSGLSFTVLPAVSRSQGKLWQDSGETVAVSSDGDPIRVPVCPYTAVRVPAASDAARPLLWDEGAGKWSCAFDGVDDAFLPPSLGLTGDFEWMAALKWTAAANNRHVLSPNSQNPTIKQYGSGVFADGDYRVYNGVDLYQCAGSAPGFGATAYHLVGLSRESGVLYARVGATDYATGLSTAASLSAVAVLSRPAGEWSAARLAGLVVVGGRRLSAGERTSLADFLTSYAA